MLETERLILRQWREDDYPIYAQLNADPVVMRYFPSLLSVQESYQQAEKMRTFIAEKGWGFWALELKRTGEFIGIIGLHERDADSGLPYAPMIEVGWRLLAKQWGNGYATEAAKEALGFAFEKLRILEVYSFTAVINWPSQRVMIKAGMTSTGEEFNHPAVPHGHELEKHCLYKITKAQWFNIIRG